MKKRRNKSEEKKMPEYLVTGGTGFIASNIINSLLKLGHTVRTTVRDPGDEEKVGFLRELKGAQERLKILKADLTVEGSFDDAVDGVDGVFHTASPVFVPQDDGDQATYVDPIIRGTTNVMNSCVKAKNTLKRVVLTSSSTAVRYRPDAAEASPLKESHWSDPEYCKRINMWYAYAKTLGEKEAWRIAAEQELDLVVVIPSCTIGPFLGPKPTSTNLFALSIIKGLRGDCPNLRGGFVHIDDVVAAHILAMEEPKASGRIICSSSVAHWSEIIEILRAKYPSYPYENKCSGEEGRDAMYSYDTSKLRELGLGSFKSLHEMFDDMIKSLQDKALL